MGIGEQVDHTVEMAELEDEPLSSQFPIDYRLRMRPLQNWLVSQLDDSCNGPDRSSLETAFESVYADLSRKSKVPTGAFGVHDQSILKQQVLAVGDLIFPFIEEMRSAQRLVTAVVMGTVMDDFVETGGTPIMLNPVSVDLSGIDARRLPQRVELSGRLPWIWQAPDDAWHCLVLTGSSRKSKVPDKYVIGPLLTLMAVCAGDEPVPWSDANRMTVHVVYRTHVLTLVYFFEQRRSAAYLSGLADDFLTPSPLLWLPFEPIFTNRKLRSLIDQDEVNDAERGAFYESMAELIQEATDVQVELTGATLTTDILDRARRRFKVFLP